jgi:hypothetical protein
VGDRGDVLLARDAGLRPGTHRLDARLPAGHLPDGADADGAAPRAC